MKQGLSFKIVIVFLSLLGLSALVGCGGLDLNMTGQTVTCTDGGIVFEANAGFSEMVDVTWTSIGGAFNTDTGMKVVWGAPHEPGTYKVTANGVGRTSNKTASKTMSVTVKQSPVEVVSAKTVSYGIYGKDFEYEIKNTGTKPITYIKLSVATFSSKDSYRETLIKESNCIINPGETATVTTSTSGASATSIIYAWPNSVSFGDGSKWSL